MPDQQLHLVLGQPATGLDQVAAALDRAPQRRGPPPGRDGGVVAAAQYLGDLPAAEVRGTGVLRVLEEPRREALVLGRLGVADHARDEPRDGFDDGERGELAAREHEVAERDLAVDEVVGDALVDALVTAAQQREAPIAASSSTSAWSRRRPAGLSR